MRTSFIHFLTTNRIFKKKIYQLGKQRAIDVLSMVIKFLNKKDKIIDIGAGPCNVCEMLLRKKFSVVPIDIIDISFIKSIEPIIYNGTKIPFENKSFDTALILAVLHHTQDPEKIINEAKRVARKIIILEDLISSGIQKYLTYILDSLMNLEFVGHPHNNKSDSEWKKIFQKCGLKLLTNEYKNRGVFKQAIYILKS